MTRAIIRSGMIGVAALVGVVGLLHLPAARPLLSRLGVACPVDAVSADQVERMHRVAVDALRGQSPAPTRRIFGLDLLTSREKDVRQWIAARGIACQTILRGLRYLSCANVAASAMGGTAAGGSALQDLTFSFDQTGVLVGIDVLRGGLTEDAAATMGSAIAARLHDQLGDPAERAGTFETFARDTRPFLTSYVKYRFTDSLMTLTAVRMPERGITVREQYVGVPPRDRDVMKKTL